MIVTKCQSCGAEIVWARTMGGKVTPVDREETLGGNIRLVYEIDGPKSNGNHAPLAKVITPDERTLAHRSHFATCPAAGKHRRP